MLNMGYVLTSLDICNILMLGFKFLSGYFLVSHTQLTYKAINRARNFSYSPNGQQESRYTIISIRNLILVKMHFIIITKSEGENFF